MPCGPTNDFSDMRHALSLFVGVRASRSHPTVSVRSLVFDSKIAP